jgi:hypothetical protein
MTAQIVISGTVLNEEPAGSLGHTVTHEQQHRASRLRRSGEQAAGDVVGHQRTVLNLHTSPAWLDHQVDPFIMPTDVRPRLHSQLR